MSAPLNLRSSPVGSPFIGENHGDTVLWDATARAWTTGPAGGAVDSVFGRTGIVVALTGDYDSDQIDNVSSVSGASVSDALETLAASVGAVDSVFGRTGVVVAVAGDYDSDEVDNASGVTGATVSDALDYLLANAGAVASVFGRTGVVTAATGDYDSDQVDNGSSVTGSSTSDALDFLNGFDSVDEVNVTGTSHNYTLVLTDAGRTKFIFDTAACTVTIPTQASVAFPKGTCVMVVPSGAGQLTINGSLVTTNCARTLVAVTIYSPVVLQLRDPTTDTWLVFGDLVGL